MQTAYLLLGSNLDDRKANFLIAKRYLSALGKVKCVSSLYQTKAWGKTDQPDFLNQVVVLNTVLKPLDLLKTILKIENTMGRQRTSHWGPRVIDIDILLIGGQIIKTPELTVPHSQLVNRRFALVPLAEVAPNMVHPETGLSIQMHLEACPDTLAVQPF